MKRCTNGICSQLCPAAPRGFVNFQDAGQGLLFARRGGVACFSVGRGEHPWLLLVLQREMDKGHVLIRECRSSTCTLSDMEFPPSYETAIKQPNAFGGRIGVFMNSTKN